MQMLHYKWNCTHTGLQPFLKSVIYLSISIKLIFFNPGWVQYNLAYLCLSYLSVLASCPLSCVTYLPHLPVLPTHHSYLLCLLCCLLLIPTCLIKALPLRFDISCTLWSGDPLRCPV